MLKPSNRKRIAVLAATAASIAFLSVGVTSTSKTVLAADELSSAYEIYPKPQKSEYRNEKFLIRKNVNVVFEEGIDSATKNRLSEVMALKNKNVTISDSKKEGATNILVGINGSGGYVDKDVKSHHQVQEGLFDKFGSYFEDADDDEIVILGKDTDGAFYGLTTLKQIFEQMDGSTINEFTLNDYADTNIRGFIEGYYGIPWSDQTRMSLMKFGGDYKMTSYIFAPKDDPYHKSKWRTLYPADRLKEIQKMVNVGNNSKTRLVYTLHVFGGEGGGITNANYNRDIQQIKDKYEQLYKAGVRQFGILGDDVGGLSRDVVVRLMNDLQKWCDEKEDCYDLVFCPAGYNHSWQGDYTELNQYDSGFDKRIKIFWTGEAVCQPIELKTLDHFRNYNAIDNQRRAPLFWLNWPVNDINHGRLMLGKGSLLHTDINPQDLAGVISNPMQEGEASKVPLFSIADYAWNIKGFNDEKTWKDSFKYIEPNASEELAILAANMSNPQPNGHGLVLEESKDIKPIVDKFKDDLQKGSDVKSSGNTLIKELTKISDAVDGIKAKSKNKELLRELDPYIASLKDTVNSDINYIKAAIALKDDNLNEALGRYNKAVDLKNNSNKHAKKTLDGTKIVDPGSTVLRPLMKFIDDQIGSEITDAAGIDKGLQITASSNMNNWYGNNKLSNICDGDLNTAAWNAVEEEVGQYFQINMSKPTDVYGIHIANGTKEKPEDTFGKAKIQYSTDGKNFVNVDDREYGVYQSNVDVTGINLKDVKALRYVCTKAESGKKWPAMREFSFDQKPGIVNFKTEVYRTTDAWGIYSGSDADLIDGDVGTAVHYKTHQENTADKDYILPSEFVGVKFDKEITLGEIDIHQIGEDYMHNSTLQYSLDGQVWTPIKSYSMKAVIFEDLSQQNIKAKYVRLVNNERQHNWLHISEFSVKAKVEHNGVAYTNVPEYQSLGADLTATNATLAVNQDIKLKKGQYIGLELDRIHELSSVETNADISGDVKLQISSNKQTWNDISNLTDVKDKNARYIRLINEGDSDTTFMLSNFKVLTKEISEKKLIDKSNFNVVNPLNVFDGDRTTNTHFQTSQNKGAFFTYDLGQEIDLNTLKIVCADGEIDFPRHMVVKGSADGEDWKPIMYFGSQDSENENESTTTDDISKVLPNHETSYYTKSVKNISQKVRYLKFEITRTKTGADKWIRFQEIEINDGAYIPSENNPTFESNTQDTKGGEFRNLTDGSLSTSFVPKEEDKYLIYHLSGNLDRNKVKIIQTESNISNAEVTANVLVDGQITSVKLGKLSQTINEFKIDKNTQLLDVKIEWTSIPNLVEMILSKDDDTDTTDFSKLNTVIEESKNVKQEGWTKTSKENFSKALTVAKSLDGTKATQAVVDNAVKDLVNATKDFELIGDKTELNNLINEAEKLDSRNYTAKTWTKFENTLAISKNITNSDDVTQDDVDVQANNLQTSIDGLKFNPSSFEEGTLDLEAAEEFIKSIGDKPTDIYTAESWDEFISAQENLAKALKSDETTPLEITDKIDKLNKSREGLKTKVSASLEDLQILIDAASKTDKTKYTKSSVEVVTDAILEAKKINQNSSLSDIKKSVDALDEALKGLEPVVDQNAAKEYFNNIGTIDESKYTTESVKSYKKAKDDLLAIKDKLDDTSAAEFNKLKDSFEDSKAHLVKKENNGGNNSGNNGGGNNNSDNQQKPNKPEKPDTKPDTKPETSVEKLNTVGTIQYVPGYGVLLRDKNGKIPAVKQYLKHGTSWKVNAKKVINGVTYYRLGNDNQWVEGKYLGLKDKSTSHKVTKIKKVGKVVYNGRGGVLLLNKDGKIPAKRQYLKKNTNWKINAKAIVNGRTLYRLGTDNQWIPAEYLKLK